jgi:hypothetical protein
MKKNVKLQSLILIFLAIAIIGLCFLSGCSAGNPGINSDEAVKIAKERVLADGVMSLDGRTPVVKDEKDHWHVSFPIMLPFVVGGEPHVFVDKASGSITKIYYTQ